MLALLCPLWINQIKRGEPISSARGAANNPCEMSSLALPA